MAASTTIHIRLTPRSSRDAIVGWDGDVLRVRVSAPPLDGRANAALLKVLVRALGVPKRDVILVRGTRARDKTIGIRGLSKADVDARLARAGEK
jgi:uncharacterized protein (TIGR00251 family)